MSLLKRSILWFLMLSLLVSSPLVAEDEVKDEINREYQEIVRPIFEKKCFSCHSKSHISWVETRFLFKDYLSDKVKSALGDFLVGESFPQENIKNELKKIRSQIENNVMPPNFALVLVNPFMGLKDEEKVVILKWVEVSLNKLNSKR